MEVIQINNISKRYGQHVLYQQASLSIQKGSTVGIVGGNGTGKSVLYKMITGLEAADEGEILVRGKPVGAGLDFPQNIGLFVNQPGYIEFYDGFTNLKMLAEIQGRIDAKAIRACMKRVGLNPDDKKWVKNYSMGMKQKLGITQAIMEEQDLILLDEPFNALDFQTNVEVVSILEGLKKEGKTVLLTSHQHEYLEKVCDVIYMILNHQLVLFDESLKSRYFASLGHTPT